MTMYGAVGWFALAFLVLQGIGCASSTGSFSESHVVQIETGVTTQRQIEEWFGLPDAINTDASGASRWVYQRRSALGAIPAELPEWSEPGVAAAVETRSRIGAFVPRVARAVALVGRRVVDAVIRGSAEFFRKHVLFPPPIGPSGGSSAPEVEVAQAQEPPPLEHADAVPEVAEPVPALRTALEISFGPDGVVSTFSYRRNAPRG